MCIAGEFFCDPQWLLFGGIEIHQSLSFHSRWGWMKRGYVWSVQVQFSCTCLSVAWSGHEVLSLFYKSWSVYYLFSYLIYHHRSCLMIWGHLIWVWVIHGQFTRRMICHLVVISHCVFSALCCHMLWLQPSYVVHGRCLWLGFRLSWGGHWLRCWLCVYRVSIMLKR